MRRPIPATFAATVCPICNAPGATEALSVRKQRLAARTRTLDMELEDLLCLNCGLVYAGARPDEAALNIYYRDAHTRLSDYVEIAPDYDVARRLDRIMRLVPAGGHILELGAGTGEFCNTLARHGFDARPVDPLGDDDWPDGDFDAVLSYLVLEHVHDPRSFIEAAARRLRPNGVFVVEVPDFMRDPVASLVPEHLWHYAPEHLSALFADCGLATVETDRTGASRAFAFALAARRDGAPRRPTFGADLVASMRGAYRRAAALAAAEDDRARALSDLVAAAQPPRVYLWGANEYATRIGRRLVDIGLSDVHLVDSAASKIGSLHDGFDGAIEPPVFCGDEPEGCLVLLCSPSWNAQIRTQVEGSRLRAPRIIDAIAWRPSARS